MLIDHVSKGSQLLEVLLTSFNVPSGATSSSDDSHCVVPIGLARAFGRESLGQSLRRGREFNRSEDLVRVRSII